MKKWFLCRNFWGGGASWSSGKSRKMKIFLGISSRQPRRGFLLRIWSEMMFPPLFNCRCEFFMKISFLIEIPTNPTNENRKVFFWENSKFFCWWDNFFSFPKPRKTHRGHSLLIRIEKKRKKKYTSLQKKYAQWAD